MHFNRSNAYKIVEQGLIQCSKKPLHTVFIYCKIKRKYASLFLCSKNIASMVLNSNLVCQNIQFHRKTNERFHILITNKYLKWKGIKYLLVKLVFMPRHTMSLPEIRKESGKVKSHIVNFFDILYRYEVAVQHHQYFFVNCNKLIQ